MQSIHEKPNLNEQDYKINLRMKTVLAITELSQKILVMPC